MEGSKRSNTCIDHLSSSTKNKDTILGQSLLSNNTSNRFKFIMTPTHGKTCGILLSLALNCESKLVKVYFIPNL